MDSDEGNGTIRTPEPKHAREHLMRWSIRARILIPLIGIQAIAVTAATLTAATLAARRSERAIVDRLNGVVDTLEHGNIPRTASVLSKMRGLSGAHFIAGGRDGQLAETSLPGLDTVPASLLSLAPSFRTRSLDESPAVTLDGTRYFAVAVPAQPEGGKAPLYVLYPETSWRLARREAAVPSLCLGVGSLAVMVLVTSWIAHRISSRIGRVKERVSAIASGDFRELELESASDEIDDLMRSVNRMCVQLKEMNQTIHQTERARLLAQLAAGLAHQLRNSLTGARLSVQLYTRRHPVAAGDETLAVALKQLELTEEQVKGLLSVGRVERKEPEICDLHQLVKEVSLLVDSTCQHTKVSLSLAPGNGAAGLGLFADRSSVRAAILNLALNAIEAAGPGGAVSVGVHASGELAVVEVADSGPGPPAELDMTLCDPFVTSKPEGVGLGLALARQVATDHGGQLSWGREGGKTCFRLALPRAAGRCAGDL
jgi:signal transduction histidine kinase